jgi:hypothetical protein
MRSTTRRSLVLLWIASALLLAPEAMAAKERSNEVASTSVAFEAGQVIPNLEHNIIKFRFLDIVIGEPNAKKDKQKVKLKMKVQNFGNHDHRVIITATLRDKDDKIVAIKTVKDHIGDNGSETFQAKYTLSPDEVGGVETVLLEVSYLKG